MPVLCWSPRSFSHCPSINHVWYGVCTLRRSAPGAAPHAAWALIRSARVTSSARSSVGMTSSAATEWERVLDFWFHQGDMRESFRHKWFPSGADNMQVRSSRPRPSGSNARLAPPKTLTVTRAGHWDMSTGGDR